MKKFAIGCKNTNTKENWYFSFHNVIVPSLEESELFDSLEEANEIIVDNSLNEYMPHLLKWSNFLIYILEIEYNIIGEHKYET